MDADDLAGLPVGAVLHPPGHGRRLRLPRLNERGPAIRTFGARPFRATRERSRLLIARQHALPESSCRARRSRSSTMKKNTIKAFPVVAIASMLAALGVLTGPAAGYASTSAANPVTPFRMEYGASVLAGSITWYDRSIRATGSVKAVAAKKTAVFQGESPHCISGVKPERRPSGTPGNPLSTYPATLRAGSPSPTSSCGTSTAATCTAPSAPGTVARSGTSVARQHVREPGRSRSAKAAARCSTAGSRIRPTTSCRWCTARPGGELGRQRHAEQSRRPGGRAWRTGPRARRMRCRRPPVPGAPLTGRKRSEDRRTAAG